MNPMVRLRQGILCREGFVFAWLRFQLATFKWGRRFLGGHWERWWIGSPVHSALWLRVPCCMYHGGARPPLGETLYGCETWDQGHVLKSGGLARQTGSGRYQILHDRVVNIDEK